MSESGRWTGLACAAGAVGLGIAHLALAGAPARDAIVNALALLIGLLLFAAVRSRPVRPDIAAVAAAAALLATALAGTSVDGVSRWVRFGPLLVQPALVLLPAAIVAFARERSWLATAAVLIAAAALALQPDRGMAGALAVATLALATLRRDRASALAAAAAIAGFAVTLARPDTLPPQPFVEGVIASSFAAGLAAGVAAALGLALLVTPALVGWRREREARDAQLAFGAIWLGVIAAAAFGDYPTPVVGYGGSAIVGYVLSLAALPRAAEARSLRSKGEASPSPAPTIRHEAAIA